MEKTEIMMMNEKKINPNALRTFPLLVLRLFPELPIEILITSIFTK
jgi:hypothetical protein